MSGKKWYFRFCFRTLPLLLPLLFLPAAAEATQLHPGEEGLYVHQMGHCLFIVSMGILIYWLRKRGLTKEAGWRCIQYSALFFILWNIVAGGVHYLEDRGDLFEVIDGGGLNQWIHLIGDQKSLGFLYYLGRMDHLLCVPAIVFLYFGLKNLLRDADTAAASGRRS